MDSKINLDEAIISGIILLAILASILHWLS